MMATTVTVRLSNPNEDTASVKVAASMTTNAGRIAANGEISGDPGINHNANQVKKPPTMKNAIEPSILLV